MVKLNFVTVYMENSNKDKNVGLYHLNPSGFPVVRVADFHFTKTQKVSLYQSIFSVYFLADCQCFCWDLKNVHSEFGVQLFRYQQRSFFELLWSLISLWP